MKYTKEQIELKSMGVYAGRTSARKLFEDCHSFGLIEKIRDLKKALKSLGLEQGVKNYGEDK